MREKPWRALDGGLTHVSFVLRANLNIAHGEPEKQHDERPNGILGINNSKIKRLVVLQSSHEDGNDAAVDTTTTTSFAFCKR